MPVPYESYLLPYPVEDEVEHPTGGETPPLRGNRNLSSFIELVDNLYWLACFCGLYTCDQACNGFCAVSHVN